MQCQVLPSLEEAAMYSEKPVLGGYDGSPSSELALRWAVDEARRRHLPLTVLHAASPDIPLTGMGLGYYQPEGDSGLHEGEQLLAEAKATVAEIAPDLPVRTRMVASAPAVALLDAMTGASVIVLGSRGLDGFSELLVGSTSLHVATHATVPVVVVHADEAVTAGAEAGRVVVGVDGSDGAQDALAFAFDEACLRGIGLTAVRAWRSDYFDSTGAKGGAIPVGVETNLFVPEATEELHKAVAGWRDKYPDVNVRERVVHAAPAKALVECARGAQLLVVGSRGRGGFRSLLLGSVGHAVLHHATCPVAVLRPAVTA
jgi:nucleotide-binding universal stress UspA family protein